MGLLAKGKPVLSRLLLSGLQSEKNQPQKGHHRLQSLQGPRQQQQAGTPALQQRKRRRAIMVIMLKLSRLTIQAMRDGIPQAPRSALKMSSVWSCLLEMSSINPFVSEKLRKEWTSPIYAFYQSTPKIGYEDGCHYHSFKCAGRGCKKK